VNGPYIAWVVDRPDVDLGTKGFAAWVGKECGRAQTETKFRIGYAAKRLGISSREVRRLVHKAVDKGCLVVDNRDETGMVWVRLPDEFVRALRTFLSDPPEIFVRPDDSMLKTVNAVKDSAGARPEAPSLTHPKGLARSPVDSGSVQNDAFARLHGITRHPDDCDCKGTDWLENPDGSVTKCPGKKRSAASEADLLEGLAGMAAKKGKPEAARSAFRAVPNRPPEPTDDDAPF
jgi:hypothetical protein